MKPPSSAVGSVDFALASAAKSSPFLRRCRICCASVGELTTIIRKPTAPEAGACQAKHSREKDETQTQIRARNFDITRREGKHIRFFVVYQRSQVKRVGRRCDKKGLLRGLLKSGGYSFQPDYCGVLTVFTSAVSAGGIVLVTKKL